MKSVHVSKLVKILQSFYSSFPKLKPFIILWKKKHENVKSKSVVSVQGADIQHQTCFGAQYSLKSKMKECPSLYGLYATLFNGLK